MSLVPATVVSRYLAKKAAFSLLSDDRFRPPAAIVNAVSEGRLKAEVLGAWKYVVEQQGDHFNYAAAVKYWRNKCNKMAQEKEEYFLPEEFQKGLGGEGAEGAFKVKTGDEIEEWVKECLTSKGLIVQVGNSVQQWELQIGHFRREVTDAQEKIDTHIKGIAEGNRVKQRQEWLEKARKTLADNQKELDKCKAALAEIKATMARYDEHKSPTIEFEKEFQFLMLLLAKDFDQETVLGAVDNAVKRFKKGLDIPMATPVDDPSKYQGYKAAGILDFLSNALAKAWEALKGAWAAFTDWLGDLRGDTKKVGDLLTLAGAPA